MMGVGFACRPWVTSMPVDTIAGTASDGNSFQPITRTINLRDTALKVKCATASVSGET